jgi:YHS domain-containing protein
MGWAAVFIGGAAALAEIPWHASLSAARAASTVSHKPVLAIFTASWSPESTRFQQQALASPEVEALIAACFEPVHVDVDVAPGVTKRLNVSHVPSACVVDQTDVPLSMFECPEVPAEFVAAVARAAQSAAGAAVSGTPKPALRGLGESTEAVADLSAAGFSKAAGDGSPQTAEAAASGGSISLVPAKDGQLSDFATTSASPTAVPSGMTPPAAAPVATTTAPSTVDPAPSRYVSATPADVPPLPQAAPAWPAEKPAPSTAFTNVTPAAPQAIEPSASTSWLAAPTAAASAAAPATAPATAPESSATAADIPATAAPKSTWSSFTAAIQNPFGWFSKAPPKAAEPPTMPPARPTSPLAAATAVAEAQPPIAPDRYGSMPLGLEGYCPVTLADRGVWTEGRAQWGVRHRGRTYLFAGPEQQQAFLATPDRYAPALSGDDPVLAVEQGRSASGRRAYGVTYQSRMYLFSSPETRATFATNPERYTASALLAERPAPTDATRRY